MNFFKRLMLKLERAAERKRAGREIAAQVVATRDPGIQVVQVTPTAPQPSPTVKTPGGRDFPLPDPRENGLGYIGRVGSYLGREEEWRRTAGTLFLGTDHLVPKNIKYPDDYAAYKSDLRNWPAMAEKFWFPETSAPDPGWQKVYERMAQEQGARTPPVAPDEPQQQEIKL